MLFEINDFLEGFEIHRNYLSKDRQTSVLSACRRVIQMNPLWTPLFATKGFVVPYALQNTNCGDYGWIGDEKGFRYTENGSNGKPFQPIPDEILEIVKEFAPENYQAENCLINFYQDKRDENGKLKKSHLGLHQDKTEKDLTAPIISISLGQACTFQIGGLTKDEPLQEIELYSGDIVIMSGKSRMAFHGVKHLLSNTCPSDLGMKSEARINITIRQVNPYSTETPKSNFIKRRNHFQQEHRAKDIKEIENKFLTNRDFNKHPGSTLTREERLIYADYLELKGEHLDAESYRNYIELVEENKKDKKKK